MEPVQNDAVDETELGATGADLPLWRAQQAIRHAALRLGVQGSAAQALEGRATSMLGWSVAGLLAVGALPCAAPACPLSSGNVPAA